MGKKKAEQGHVAVAAALSFTVLFWEKWREGERGRGVQCCIAACKRVAVTALRQSGCGGLRMESHGGGGRKVVRIYMKRAKRARRHYARPGGTINRG